MKSKCKVTRATAPPKAPIDEFSEVFDTEISPLTKVTAISTPPHSNAPSVKQRKSVSSSVASVGSLLARGEQQSYTQPTTEGRLKLRTTLDCGDEALCCKWSSDGTTLGVCLRSGEIRFYTPNGQLSLTLPAPQWKPTIPESNLKDANSKRSNSKDPFEPTYTQIVNEHLMKKYLQHPAATSLIWHSERSDLITSAYSDGQIFTWEIPDSGLPPKKPLASTKGAGIDVKCASSPVGVDRSFVTFTPQKAVLRDMSTLSSILEFKSPRPVGCPLKDAGSIWAVSGRGKEVIGGGHSLIWWDMRTGEIKKEVGAIRIRGPALAVQAGVNRMVTGSYGNGNDTVKIWEASAGKITHTLFSESYNTCVKCTAWVGRDVIVVGGSDPHLIRVVNLDNTTVGGIKGLKHGVTFIDGFAARGHQTSKLAAASGVFVYIIDLPK